MAAPFSAAVVDNFNRANVDPLYTANANYYNGTPDPVNEGGHIPGAGYAIVSNVASRTLVTGGVNFSNMWVASTFTQPEAFFTFNSWHPGNNGVALGIYLRATGLANTSTFTAYYCKWNINANSYSTSLTRCTNGVKTQNVFTGSAMQVTGGTTPAAGDKFGVRVYDWLGYPMIEWWWNPVVIGAWSRVAAFRDTIAPITGAGYTGFGLDTQDNGFTYSFDNWAVAETTPPTTYTVNTDSFPSGAGSIPFPLSGTILSGAMPDEPGLAAEIKGSISIPWIPPNITAKQDPLAEKIRSTAPPNAFTMITASSGGGVSVSE